MESLSYKLKVDSSNALLVYKFAVVLEDPHAKGVNAKHAKFEEPRFKVTLFNEKGDTIRNCSNYDVYASDANDDTSKRTIRLEVLPTLSFGVIGQLLAPTYQLI